MSSLLDEIPERLRGIVARGEELLWVGRPGLLSLVARDLPILLVTCGVSVLTFCQNLGQTNSHKGVPGLLVLDDPELKMREMILMLPIILLPLWVLLVIWTFRWRNSIYLVTNRRILLPEGVFGVPGRTIDHETVGEVKVETSWMDSWLKVETVKIHAGRIAPLGSALPETLVGIRNAREVVELVKRLARSGRSEGGRGRGLAP